MTKKNDSHKKLEKLKDSKEVTVELVRGDGPTLVTCRRRNRAVGEYDATWIEGGKRVWGKASVDEVYKQLERQAFQE